MVGLPIAARPTGTHACLLALHAALCLQVLVVLSPNVIQAGQYWTVSWAARGGAGWWAVQGAAAHDGEQG